MIYNQDATNLSYRRQTDRIKNSIEQGINKRRDIDSIYTERNQGAGQQARNIGGTVRSDTFAFFGLGGGNTVGD